MGVGIQLGMGQGAIDEAGFVRGFVEPGAAEESCPLDDVELAKLGRDHPGDSEARAPDVGARHVDRVRGHVTRRQLGTDGLDALEDVRTGAEE